MTVTFNDSGEYLISINRNGIDTNSFIEQAIVLYLSVKDSEMELQCLMAISDICENDTEKLLMINALEDAKSFDDEQPIVGVFNE